MMEWTELAPRQPLVLLDKQGIFAAAQAFPI
jgi:hypothetical protein